MIRRVTSVTCHCKIKYFSSSTEVDFSRSVHPQRVSRLDSRLDWSKA